VQESEEYVRTAANTTETLHNNNNNNWSLHSSGGSSSISSSNNSSSLSGRYYTDDDCDWVVTQEEYDTWSTMFHQYTNPSSSSSYPNPNPNPKHYQTNRRGEAVLPSDFAFVALRDMVKAAMITNYSHSHVSEELSPSLSRDLAHVWVLSDADMDGALTVKEWCTAIYLCGRMIARKPLPRTLPIGGLIIVD
jgi:hypothetical protein